MNSKKFTKFVKISAFQGKNSLIRTTRAHRDPSGRSQSFSFFDKKHLSAHFSEQDFLEEQRQSTINNTSFEKIIEDNFKVDAHISDGMKLKIERYHDRIQNNPALNVYYNTRFKSFDIQKLRAFDFVQKYRERRKNNTITEEDSIFYQSSMSNTGSRTGTKSRVRSGKTNKFSYLG